MINSEVYQNVFRDAKPTKENSWTFLESLVNIAKMLRKVLRFCGLCAKFVTSALQRSSNRDCDQNAGFVREARTSSLSKIFAGICAVTHCCVSSIPGIGRLVPISWWSRWIEKCITRSSIEWRVLLDHSLVDVPILRPSKNHTHGNSASYRTSFNIALKRLARTMGHIPYQVSGAKADHGDSDGCRYFYGLKDLKIQFKDQEVGKVHVILMTDVDYHLNINDYLRYGRPIIMYTFVPKVPGRVTDEYSYCIRDNRVYYSVSGGAAYDHELWDYSGDTVSVIDDEGYLVVFDICQREIDGDEDHRIIGLFPTCKVPFPLWINFKIKEGFERKRFTYNGYNIIRNSDVVSLSKNGSMTSYSIDESVYMALRTRLERKDKTVLAIGDVERHLARLKIENPQLAAAQVLECVERLSTDELLLLPNNPKTTSISTCYQTLTPLVNEQGKECAVVLTSPLVVNPAVFPMKSYNNDVATIRGRVDQVRNSIWPDRWYETVANEFINRLVPAELAGTGCPLSIGEVGELQSRPMQQARTRLAEHRLGVECENNLKAFIKSEGYSNFTDPRNITTMSAELTVMLSCFTYAFKQDVLKNKWWYAPGQDPQSMLNNLATICRNGSIVSDFSRLDGSVSAFLQLKVVFPAYMKWCNDSVKVEFKKHFDSVFKKAAVTSNGYRYDPGYGTRSGSPLTTDGNTIILAYVCYCTLVKTGLKPDEAWNGLGLYCGDDAVNSNHHRFPECFKTVCHDLGLTVEVKEIEPGFSVPFLGRVFVDPTTSNDSIQDPRRTLPKIHLAAKRETFSVEQMAYNKAAGYYVTDKLTPIISIWCEKVMTFSGVATVHKLSPEDAWRINSAWPQEDSVAIRELFKEIMEIDESVLSSWESELRATQHLGDFPVIWDNERKVNVDCVFDGELLLNTTTRQLIKPKRVNLIREALCQTKIPSIPLNNPETSPTQSRSKPPTSTGSSTRPSQPSSRSSTNTLTRQSPTKGKGRHPARRRKASSTRPSPN